MPNIIMISNIRRFSTKPLKKVIEHNFDAVVLGAGGAGLRT